MSNRENSERSHRFRTSAAAPARCRVETISHSQCSVPSAASTFDRSPDLESPQNRDMPEAHAWIVGSDNALDKDTRAAVVSVARSYDPCKELRHSCVLDEVDIDTRVVANELRGCAKITLHF